MSTVIDYDLVGCYSYQKYFNWIDDLPFGKEMLCCCDLRNTLMSSGSLIKVCIWRWNTISCDYTDLKIALRCRCDESNKIEFACDFKESMRNPR